MNYDIVIIGGGPAGLTAGIYAAWMKAKAVLIEKAAPGGQVLLTERIDNYPGFPDGINGPELSEKMEIQARKFGLEIINAEVEKVEKNENKLKIRLKNGVEILAYSVIIATGASVKKLGVKGEDDFIGKGVSYCATCDGPFFKNKEIALIGGGNAAVEEAVFLTKFVKNINLIHRKSMLRAAESVQEALKKTGKVTYYLESVVLEILGKNKVEGIRIKNVATGNEKIINCDGVFVFVGVTPNTEIFKDLLNLDKNGFIKTGDDMAAELSGIFACGDVRIKDLKQVITASGDGAVAAFNAERYVEKIKGIVYK